MVRAVEVPIAGDGKPPAESGAEEELDPTEVERMEELEDDAAMTAVYEAMSGVADSTESGYTSAIAAFNIFAEKQGYPHFRDFTRNMLVGGSKVVPKSIGIILAKFCTFLIEYKIEKEGKQKGKHFKPGSQKQYLSGVKTVWKKKFKGLAYFKNDEEEYKDLLKRLMIRGRVAAIQRGESPADTTEGLHWDALVHANDELIHQDRYADRAVFNAQYHAVGRSSEVGTWSWSGTSWNPRQEQLESDWRETKMAKNGLMTWHCDAESFEVDMYHSIAAYIATADGKFDIAYANTPCGEGASMVFPEFYDLASGSAANKVSKILSSLVRIVDDLTDDHTGHSLRVGSANDMVFHHHFNMVAAIARGNWDFTGDCTIFSYWTMKLFVAMAGKCLCAWKDPQQDVYCPKLDSVLTSDNASMFENWMTMLFLTVGIPELGSNGKLKHFCPVMLASLLKEHGKMCKTYGYQNCLVHCMIDSARVFNIDNNTLLEWSKMIESDWRSQNATNFCQSEFTSHKEKQTIIIQEQNKQIVHLEKTVMELRDDQRRDSEKLDRILELLENDGESPRKRKKNIVDETPASTEKAAASINAFSVVMKTAKPINPYATDGHLRNTTLRQLLKTVVESRIAWSNKKETCPFGNNISRSLKQKVVKLLEAVHASGDDALFKSSCCTEEQKPYLLGSSIPMDKSSKEYREWMEYSSKIYASVEKKFMFYLAEEWNAVLKTLLDMNEEVPHNTKSFNAGDYGSIKGKTALKSEVGTLASTVENLRALKKKIDQNKKIAAKG